MIRPLASVVAPVVAFMLALAAPLPAAALTLAELAGQWQGEGTLTVAGDPAQRLRCQMRGTALARGVAVVGRCATAQGSQSFAWNVSEGGEGALVAEDASPAQDDPSAAPARMAGRRDAEGLRFDLPNGGAFALSPGGDGQVALSILSRDDQGRAVRAETLLTRRP